MLTFHRKHSNTEENCHYLSVAVKCIASAEYNKGMEDAEYKGTKDFKFSWYETAVFI